MNCIPCALTCPLSVWIRSTDSVRGGKRRRKLASVIQDTCCSVSLPRTYFQSRRKVETPSTLLPHNTEELWDGEEKPRREGAGGSPVPCGGITKNRRWNPQPVSNPCSCLLGSLAQGPPSLWRYQSEQERHPQSCQLGLCSASEGLTF